MNRMEDNTFDKQKNDEMIDQQQYQIRKVMNTILACIILLACIMCRILAHLNGLLINGLLIVGVLLVGLQIMSFFRKNTEDSDSETTEDSDSMDSI